MPKPVSAADVKRAGLVGLARVVVDVSVSDLVALVGCGPIAAARR